MRTAFASPSTLSDGELTLATPIGHGESDPRVFFRGFVRFPLVITQGLFTLADVARTHYYRPRPAHVLDPLLSAEGTRVRLEAFSACSSLYARFDIEANGFEEGATCGRGTTNVDLTYTTRALMATVSPDTALHLSIGTAGATVSTLEGTATERPVRMPRRWWAALATTAALFAPCDPVAHLDAASAVRLILAPPPPETPHWRIDDTGIVGYAQRRADTIRVASATRLRCMSRLAAHVTAARVFSTPTGQVLVEFSLPGGRFTLGLSRDVSHGFSGEGVLLSDLADDVSQVTLVDAALSVGNPVDVEALSRITACQESAVRQALAAIALTGRLGWDAGEHTYFVRELAPQAATPTPTRLANARALLAAGAVRDVEGRTLVRSLSDPSRHYRVAGAVCTCPWYERYRGERGPCAHVLARQLAERASP